MPAQNSLGDPDMDAVLAQSPSAPKAPSSLGDPDMDAVLSQASQQSTQPSSEWSFSNLGRQVGLMGRAMIKGVTALPSMIPDAVVAGKNIVTGHVPLTVNGHLNWSGQADAGATPLPSQSFDRALTTAGLPEPKTAGEKIAGIVEGALTSAALPGPTVKSDVPDNFMNAQQMADAARLESVRKGAEAGYKIPPATTNPTLINKALETTSGKIATQQAASSANQAVTNRLAAEALGLNPEVPITEASLNAIRSKAAQNYQAIGRVSSIALDQTFKDQIKNVVSQFNKTAEELPSLANKDLEPVATDLLAKDAVSGNAILGAVKGLRNKADMAFRAGDGSTGSAYRQMSNALENAVDRDLSSRGPEFGDLVGAFRDARQKIAMAHTVEDAMNPGTGNIVASKLAAALRRGEPLSGNLRTVAEFANSVPKAVQEPTSSSVSHLDVAVPAISGLTEALTHGLGPGTAAATAAYPVARAASKWWLMGPGQAAALPKVATETATQSPWWLRGIPGAVAGGQ